MSDNYQIVYIEKPEESAWGIIGNGVGRFNDAQVGDQGFQRICYGLQDGDGKIVAGGLAELYYGWLHVDLLWVDEPLRGQGHGSRLLAKLEEEGKKRGAKGAFLDTFSFQAPDFYERQGYEKFGELAAFPEGHSRFFMRKAL